MKANYLKFLAISLCMVPFACTEPDPVEEGNASIELNPTEYTAEDYGQQTFAVTVTANCKWSVTTLDDSGARADWLQTDTQSGEGNGTFNVRLLENESASERTANVAVSSSNSSVTKYIKVTQPGSQEAVDPGPGPVEGYSFPIVQMFECADGIDIPSDDIAFGEHEITGATHDETSFTFEKGMVIERSQLGETPSEITTNIPSHTNNSKPGMMKGFLTGIAAYNWVEGDYWLIKIPVKEDLSGNLRFCYGSRKEANAGGATYSWSSDEGATWNDFSGPAETAKSDAVWKSVKFTIPEAQKVSAGKYLWIKLTFSAATDKDKYVTFANGLAIVPAEAELSDVPAQDNSSVVFSEGFDDLIGVNAMYIDIPVGYMKGWTTATKPGSYTPSNPIMECTLCYEKPGFIQIGYADESNVNRNSAQDGYGKGSFSLKVGERLKEMGLNTADLTVKFKCAGITTGYGYPVEAIPTLTATTGTVENGTIENLSMDAFQEYTMTVKGADQSTVLTLTSADVTTSAFLSLGMITSNGHPVEPDYRFFVDDILITTAE